MWVVVTTNSCVNIVEINRIIRTNQISCNFSLFKNISFTVVKTGNKSLVILLVTSSSIKKGISFTTLAIGTIFFFVEYGNSWSLAGADCVLLMKPILYDMQKERRTNSNQNHNSTKKTQILSIFKTQKNRVEGFAVWQCKFSFFFLIYSLRFVKRKKNNKFSIV